MISIQGNTEAATVQKTAFKYFETGHAKNVANFDLLISYVAGYGTDYNPGKELLSLPSLQLLSVQAKQALTNVNLAHAEYTSSVTVRELAYKSLNKIVTDIMLSMKVYEPSKAIYKDAQSYARKVKGGRATPKKTQEEIDALMEKNVEVKYNSVSQLSYDSRVENFDKLVTLVESIPNYVPNEEHLKATGLRAKHADFKLKNATVVGSTTILSNSRLERNKILYHPETGMYFISIGVKSYVRSIYGLNSPQYKQIMKINFSLRK